MKNECDDNLTLQTIFKDTSIPLLEIDTKFGLVSAINCLAHLRQQESFSFADCLLKMRECVATQDLLFGTSDSSDSTLKNFQRAESLVFQKRIESNRLPKNFLKKIFSILYKKNYLESENYTRNKDGSYSVTKKQTTDQTKEYDSIEKYVSMLSSNLFPTSGLLDTFVSTDNPLNEPQLEVMYRIKSSVKLLEKMNTGECRKNFSSPSTFPHEYQNLLNFPLVSISKENDNIILYILSCFQSPEINLGRSHIHMDHLFFNMLQNSPNIKTMIRSIAKEFAPRSKMCYGNKLFIRKPNTNHLFVITHLSFSKDELLRSNEKGHRLKKVYAAVDRELKNTVYFKPNEYFTFALGEVDDLG